MELSAEVFESTLHRIKGDGGTGGVERRTKPRVGLRARIKLLPLQHGVVGAPVDVWTRDISLTGVGVITSKRMKVGDHYILTLPREQADSNLVLYCTVRNCEALVTDIYAVGLSFEALRGREAA